MADQLALTSPGSSDAPMEGHARPAEMAVLNFSRPQDLTALDNINIHMSFPASQHPTNSFKPWQAENRLALWYHRNDGPWTPASLAPSQGDTRNATILRNNQLMFSSQYRGSPSECDTILPGGVSSDSGYGSYAAKHSVANGSVCDEPIDRNHELLGELDFTSYNRDTISKVSTEAPWSQSQPTPPSPQSAIGHQANPQRGNVCDVCKKVLKTKSEFKKHKQRHDKPFRCTVKGCTRREGFTTPNDLDRHKKSLHPYEHAHGDRYRCQVGPCLNKDKIWPRADNFRAHMKRVHQKDLVKDEDLEQYKYSLEAPPLDISDVACNTTPPKFDKSDMFSGAGGSDVPGNWKIHRSPVIEIPTDTSPVESQIQVEEPSLAIRPSKNRLDGSNSGTTQDVDLESEDAPFDQTEAPRPSSPQVGPSLDDSEPINTGQLKGDEPSLHSKISSVELANGVNPLNHCQADGLDEPRGHPSELSLGNLESNIQPDRLLADNGKVHMPPEQEGHELLTLDFNNPECVSKLLEQLQIRGMLPGVLKLLQIRGLLPDMLQKNEDPQESETAKQEPANNTITQQGHFCPQCSKPFNRRCELKKHEKRHSKPYGCTQEGCKKRFGSKNDWKRHENSQHTPVEHWICEMRADESSEACGNKFLRRELFKQHLSVSHHIEDQNSLDHKIETCRIGRDVETLSWCGFCQAYIKVTPSDRFNHIDDHYFGRNNREKRIFDEWIVDGARPESTTPQVDGSGDISITSSEPASSSNGPNIHKANGVEKPPIRVANQKRKRVDESGLVASKRAETVEEITTYICCECREAMSVISRQCVNTDCQHKLCVNCPS
ncbi:hypothetical protein F5Y11DRAFT_347031 [Daldinia sp. FL1419]|nr:hypothetical protein F5Y11DRAFT_347031 [Daldinia sp. FL1419]